MNRASRTWLAHEPVAGQPGPVQGVLAFLNPLLGSTSAIVEMHSSCRGQRHRRKTDQGIPIGSADLPAQLASELSALGTVGEMLEKLSDAEQTEATQNLTSELENIAEDGLSPAVFNQVLDERLPKYLYFDEYYQIKGQDNLDSLQERIAQGTLQESDYPLIGLIELARLDLAQLTQSGRTEALFSKLEAAANSLSQRVLRHWSQNQHLRMSFDIHSGQPEDPPGMIDGVNIWGRVEDM